MKRRKAPSKKLTPVTFVPVEKVFKAMVEIRAVMDISGWADRTANKKWGMKAGETYIIDEDKAREFVAKGYAKFTQAPKQDISDDERAEHLSTVTTLTPGGNGSG